MSISELVTMVNIAIGNAPISACPAGDRNDDAGITIDELILAVNNAIDDCPDARAR